MEAPDMNKRFLMAIVLCVACDTPAPAPVETVPLPGEWTLVAINNSPVPFDFGGARCIHGEQMRIDEDGHYSRTQSSSVYKCQDPEYVTSLTGQWALAAAGYSFSQDQENCAHPPAAAKLTRNSLVIDWIAESPSRGNPCYSFTWTFSYRKK
jgi:hypothetical protein